MGGGHSPPRRGGVARQSQTGAPGAKREPRRAKPQLVVSSAKRCAGLLLRLRPIGLALRATPSAPLRSLRNILLTQRTLVIASEILDVLLDRLTGPRLDFIGLQVSRDVEQRLASIEAHTPEKSGLALSRARRRRQEIGLAVRSPWDSWQWDVQPLGVNRRSCTRTAKGSQHSIAVSSSCPLFLEPNAKMSTPRLAVTGQGHMAMAALSSDSLRPGVLRRSR